MRRFLTVTLLLVACAEAPEVSLSTRVGEPVEEDPSVALESAQRVATALWEARQVRTEVEIDTEAVVTPPTTPKEFAALVEAVRTGPIEEIAAPARNLAQSDPANWILVRSALLAERKHPKGEYRSMLAVIGGDVPNRYGHFALHWKKAHGHRVKLSEDWFEDLLGMPLSKTSRSMHDVYRDLVLEVALMHATAHIGRSEPTLAADATNALLDAAYLHRGTFRDEVGRALTAMGDEAVPYLLLESIPPSTRKRDADSIPVKRANYALYSLDRMDRLHPQRAIAAVADDQQRLVRLLDAYREVKMGEAAPFILDYVDAASPTVRTSAREAMLAYVVGPTPKIRKKRLRVLGGGTTTRSAHVSYRGLAKRAIRERLAEERPELLEEECDLFVEGEIDPYCEKQPERLTRAYIDWLTARRRAKQEGIVVAALASDDREQAISRIDQLLAAGAQIDRPARLVPLFEAAADEATLDGRPSRAAQLLRKSSMLLASTDADAATQLRARALIHEASVEGLDQQGRNMLLETARALAGDDQTLLDMLRDARSEQSFEDHGEIEDQLRNTILLLLVAMIAAWLAGRAIRRQLRMSTGEEA